MTVSTCNVWDLTVDEWLSSQSITTPTRIQECVFVCTFVVVTVWIVSELTQNYSQVDKLWSVLPVLYAWILVSGDDDRTFIMALLLTIWGGRLTYNFSRRCGYQWPPWTGDEDYRCVDCVINWIGSGRLKSLPIWAPTDLDCTLNRLCLFPSNQIQLIPDGNTSKMDICCPFSKILLHGNFSISSSCHCIKIYCCC